MITTTGEDDVDGLSALDRVNRPRWSRPEVVQEYVGGDADLTLWSDAGERAAVTAIADEVRGTPILDLGVGGGRTVALCTLLSDAYVAVDYMPEMVAACAARHPGVDVRLGDARTLTGFPDRSRGLVLFSYNGLDAVDHDERLQALREIARVLRPGGVLQFSTLNLDGPAHRATPLRPAGSQLAHTWSPMYRLALRVLWLLHAPITVPRARRNRAALQKYRVDGDGWAIAPLESHDFGLLVHYTTLRSVRADLAQAGLTLEAVFDAEHGLPVHDGHDVSGTRYFQLVARKPR